MSSFFYPHTITVYPVTSDVGYDGIGENPQVGTGVSVAADVQALKSGQAFDLYGLNLSNPLQVFVKPSDVDKFGPQFRVDWQGVPYYVQGTPQNMQAGDTLDHAVILLDRLKPVI
jgi:hypothetical protein